MPICPFCNAEIDMTKTFCIACGSGLVKQKLLSIPPGEYVEEVPLYSVVNNEMWDEVAVGATFTNIVEHRLSELFDEIVLLSADKLEVILKIYPSSYDIMPFIRDSFKGLVTLERISKDDIRLSVCAYADNSGFAYLDF